MDNNNYTNEVIFDLFVLHGRCDGITDRTCRVFNLKYPHLMPMNRYKFKRLQKKFVRTGNMHPPRDKVKFVTENEDNQINVLGYFAATPRTSIRAAVNDLGLTYSSIQRILCLHKLHPYSFIRLQKLRPTDYPRRTNFCEEVLIKIQENPDYLKLVIWTDEAKFAQCGVFNRRNRHFWARQNPNLIVEVEHQIQFSINVFCLLMDNKVQWYLYDENLNGERYSDIVTNVVANFLDDLPLRAIPNVWYQMDGAPAHNAAAVERQLRNLFEDRWWGNRGPWLWPARSPDLTPLDFYLWGRVKDEVYQTEPRTLPELTYRINEAMNALDPNEIRRATGAAVHRRIIACLEQNGGHIENIL